jgi:hypothetical protein
MARARNINIDQAWEILFDRHNIYNAVSQYGSFKISSAEINTVKEARLMAKFDQSTQLPQIFKSNNLSILPISRGEYIIGQFKTHMPIHYGNIKAKPVEIPDLQTIDYTNLYSESSALLFAFNSGIINDVLNCNRVNFTVNGRMSSGCFEYQISNSLNQSSIQNIYVQNAQVEIDGGYETPDTFCICEAKNIAVEEVLIRQLYYPYRLWKNKILKRILPVFMVYSNDVFHTFTYQFDNECDYNSLRLQEHNAYTFADESISISDIIDLWRSTTPLHEPEITFPQADSFARIVDLLSILYESPLTRDEVTIKYEFDGRQTNYYISACEYLGLIKRFNNEDGERVYQLTTEAQSIMGLRYKQKYLALIQKIFMCPIFYKVFQLAIEFCETPDKNTICRIMHEGNLGLSPVTIERRSSTVRSWIDWILRLSNSD